MLAVLSIVKAGESFAYAPTLLMEQTSKAIQGTVAKPGALPCPATTGKWADRADIERKV
jgi:hypothetical protein